MATQTVYLPEEWNSFIVSRVASGDYPDANAVVVDALRALKREREDEVKAMWLEQAIEDGFASGIADGDAFARVRERAGLPTRVR